MQLPNEKFVVLWSPHQDAVQIETVGEMLETNRRIFLEGKKGDFIVLAFADTYEGAVTFSDDLLRVRDNP